MKTKSSTRGIAISLIVAGLAMGGMPSAMAVRWYSKPHPLLAHQDSDPRNPKILAAGFGNFYNRKHTYARSAVWYLDRQPKGHKVYGETKFLFHSADPSCGSDQYGRYVVCWHETASDQTGRTDTGLWDGPWASDEPLDAESTQARAKVHVCEDQPHAPDDCSPFAIVTFSY